MMSIESNLAVPTQAERQRSWIGYTPIAVLPLATVACRGLLLPWVFMWCLSFCVFAGLKWPTWWRARGVVPHATWRSVAYLIAWPGMDAVAFLGDKPYGMVPTRSAWFWAFLKTGTGAALIWLVARSIPARMLLLRGWVGMTGLILLLHFGGFEVIAFAWQTLGVNAVPIMSAPFRSTSLREFWGRRWNLGFRQVAHDLIFRPLQARLGARTAGLLVFVASGLIHELVISVPARGGYGLPTTYFALQGLGVVAERSVLGRRVGLGEGWRGWLFTAAFTAGPVLLLFHHRFVLRVILPFLAAMRAL